jgi:hypothetical protein
MGLFPRKYCNQTHIQSQLFQRQKMIFYNDKLIYTQNLKFYLNNFTELRNDEGLRPPVPPAVTGKI